MHIVAFNKQFKKYYDKIYSEVIHLVDEDLLLFYPT